ECGRPGAQVLAVRRHLPPAKELLPFCADCVFKYLHAPAAFLFDLGEEHHAHAIFTLLGQTDTMGFGLMFEKCVGDLNENPGGVAGLRVAPAGASMFEVEKDFEALFYDLVRLLSVNVGYEADATCVMLKCGIV